jgi:hypothetical protein
MPSVDIPPLHCRRSACLCRAVSGLGLRHLCIAVLHAFTGHLEDSRQILMLAPAGEAASTVADAPKGDGHLLPRRAAVLLSDCLTHAGVKVEPYIRVEVEVHCHMTPVGLRLPNVLIFILQ